MQMYTSDPKRTYDYYSPDSMAPNEFGQANKSTYHAIGDPGNKMVVGPKADFTDLNIIEINRLYQCHTGRVHYSENQKNREHLEFIQECALVQSEATTVALRLELKVLSVIG